MLKILQNATVFDPAPRGLQHLLVAGSQIVWLGHEPPVLPAMLQVDTFDVGGRFVVPGLVDGHAHTTGGGGEAGYASRVPAPHLSQFVHAGVTTVVGLLGTDDTTRDTSQLLAATRTLRAEGMSAYCYTGGYRIPPVTFTGDVRSDIVNLDPVIGVGEIAISDHRSSQPTYDELLRVASDAHVAGLMTGKAGVLHLHLGDGERGLSLVRRALAESELPGRVFNPTHCNRNPGLMAEAFELVGAGCTIDLTAFPVADDDIACSAATALLRYLQSGLPADQITISSDGGGCLPVFDEQGQIVSADTALPTSLLDTLREALQLGIELPEVLATMTANPSALLRLPAKGRLAAGMDADLLVLNDAYEVDAVMALGEWHLRDGEVLKQGTFE